MGLVFAILFQHVYQNIEEVNAIGSANPDSKLHWVDVGQY